MNKTLQALYLGTDRCSLPRLVDVRWSTLPRSTSAVTLDKACRTEDTEINTRGCVQDADMCINSQPRNQEFALQIDNFHEYQTYTVVQFIAYRDLKEYITNPVCQVARCCPHMHTAGLQDLGDHSARLNSYLTSLT